MRPHASPSLILSFPPSLLLSFLPSLLPSLSPSLVPSPSFPPPLSLLHSLSLTYLVQRVFQLSDSFLAACPNGRYGYGCLFHCECSIYGLCNHVTGECLCSPGSLGKTCSQGKNEAPKLHICYLPVGRSVAVLPEVSGRKLFVGQRTNTFSARSNQIT